MNKISPSSCLTRYITQKSYYRPSNGTVRHNAFMPPPNRKLSVFQISDLPSKVIWDLGTRFVASPQDKPLLGRADIFASSVMSQELRVVPEMVPHPSHANIVGWPDDNEKVRMIAVDLAAEAELQLKIN